MRRREEKPHVLSEKRGEEKRKRRGETLCFFEWKRKEEKEEENTLLFSSLFSSRYHSPCGKFPSCISELFELTTPCALNHRVVHPIFLFLLTGETRGFRPSSLLPDVTYTLRPREVSRGPSPPLFYWHNEAKTGGSRTLPPSLAP